MKLSTYDIERKLFRNLMKFGKRAPRSRIVVYMGGSGTNCMTQGHLSDIFQNFSRDTHHPTPPF